LVKSATLKGLNVNNHPDSSGWKDEMAKATLKGLNMNEV